MLASVVTTLRQLSDFESLRLSIRSSSGPESTDWTGEALCVLVGSGRRFDVGGNTQADMEDGRFEVGVITGVSTLDLMGDIAERLFGQEATEVVRFRAADILIRSHDPDSVRFSLDGEMVSRRELSLETAPGAIRVAVGEAYDPHPAP